MYLMSAHGWFLGLERETLVHVADMSDSRVLKIDEPLPAGGPTADGPFSGFVISRSAGGVSLSREGRFVCAIPGSEILAIDRIAAADWETFLELPVEDVIAVQHATRNASDEMARFARRVADLNAAGQPVKVYAGCGTVLKSDFLNIDVAVHAPLSLRKRRDEYFIFPFADRRWDISDGSVDYIFDEDLVEHISQTMQWQYLSETLRVLKAGCFHRVSTPNIITAMKRHSRFPEGAAGVYTGEEKWGHIAMLSPFQLKEIAETIGYSEVIFTTRNCGVSPFAGPDFRPGSDRDDLSGNIYADLRK